jgi:8-oxo-dGTP pyrophosphatase MutT (NUDIX family)
MLQVHVRGIGCRSSRPKCSHRREVQGKADEDNRHPRVQSGGKWALWGGQGEEGERPEACAIRELREELGGEIAEPQARKFLLTRVVDGREASVFAYFFEADGTPPVYEGERAEWFTPGEAGRMSMAFGAEVRFSPEVVARAKAALALE